VSPEQEALVEITRALESLGILHMVAGSVASSYHGRPRSTHDVDIVIDPSESQLEALLQILSDRGFYVDAAHAKHALLHRLQFNTIDVRSAFKIDLIFRKDRAFSHEELGRRQAVELSPGIHVLLASPEDTIVSKLEWAKKAGRSERQLEDAAGVLAVNPGLDRGYVEKWARELGVFDLWLEIARQRPAGA
jgi:hypothetical protein